MPSLELHALFVVIIIYRSTAQRTCFTLLLVECSRLYLISWAFPKFFNFVLLMRRAFLLSADFSCIVFQILFINASTLKRMFKINQKHASLKWNNLRLLCVLHFNLCKNVRYCFWYLSIVFTLKVKKINIFINKKNYISSKQIWMYTHEVGKPFWLF
jgi:hypothetical protein